MKRHPNMERFSELIQFVVKAPRTAPELVKLMAPCHQDTVKAYLDTLHADGLVFRSRYRPMGRNQWVCVWAWQEMPFDCEDAKHPTEMGAAELAKHRQQFEATA